MQEISWKIINTEERVKEFNKYKYISLVILLIFSFSSFTYGYISNSYLGYSFGILSLIVCLIFLKLYKFKLKSYFLDESGIRIIINDKTENYRWDEFKFYNDKGYGGGIVGSDSTDFWPFIFLEFFAIFFIGNDFGKEGGDSFFYLKLKDKATTHHGLKDSLTVHVEKNVKEQVQKYIESKLEKK